MEITFFSNKNKKFPSIFINSDLCQNALKVNCLPAKEIRDSSIYLASAMMTETDVNQLLPCLVKNDNNLECYNCPNRKFIEQ